jgi:glycerate kinase
MSRLAIPCTVLIAPDRYSGRLTAARAAAAIAAGLAAGGWERDVCPLGDDSGPDGWRSAMRAAHFDERLDAVRAVVTGAATLDRAALVGSLVAEVATSARQAGVPCYAVVGRNSLSAFEQRILDLDAVMVASDPAGLERAGRELGTMLWPPDARPAVSGRRLDGPLPAPAEAGR